MGISSEWIIIIIVFLSLFFLSKFIYDKGRKAEYREQLEIQIAKQNKMEQLIKDNVIDESKKYINKDFTKAVVIDEINNKIHFLFTSNNNCRTYNFNDIIQSEIMIDNSTITQTNRGKQVVGSLIGGAIAGVPGMIIGGLSGENVTSEKIKHIDIKLTFNDFNNPIEKIHFLESSSVNNGVSKDSQEYRMAMNFVERWHGYFSIILNQQNKAI